MRSVFLSIFLLCFCLIQDSLAQVNSVTCSGTCSSISGGCNIPPGGSCIVTVGADQCTLGNGTAYNQFIAGGTNSDWNSFMAATIPGLSRSCNATPAPGCGAGSQTWSVGGYSCTGSVASATSSNSSVATDSTNPDTGSATYLCNSGTWVLQSGATCASTAACPAGENKTWGAGCSGTTVATSTSSGSVSNTASGYSGSATFACDLATETWAATPTSQSCTASAGPPTGFSLSHTANNRLFNVSWSAGSGNGGASGCKLQHTVNGGTFTDISGTFNCDANVSTTVSLPSSSTWWAGGVANLWGSSGGVSVRLVRVSDSSVLHTFTQKLTCSAGTSTSTTPTPDVDEDCQKGWDNQEYLTCNAAETGYTCPKTIGASYDFSPRSCKGVTMNISSLVWYYFPFSNVARYYTGSGCVNFGGYTGIQHEATFPGTPTTGTVPGVTTNGGAGVFAVLNLGSTTCVNDGTGTQSYNIVSPLTAWALCDYEYVSPTKYYH